MTKLHVLLTYAAVLSLLSGRATADDRTTRVDDIFADLARADSPGATIAVVQDGAVTYLQGYGMADLEHRIRMTPQTVFDIASVSKQFGAMAAILLMQEGKLSLSDDVTAYVPEIPDVFPEIRVEHLVHHTSGIRDWPHVMALAGVAMSDVISFRQILMMLTQQRDLNFEPGTEYSYSNTGYNLLAEIVQRVSGTSFRRFTQDRIFEPLGMRRTRFQDDESEMVVDRARSYEPAGSGYRNAVNQLTALGSSSLHTTMEDFTRWMVNYDTMQVGGQAGLDRLQERGVLNDGHSIPYAFGLVHGAYRGVATLSHGGSWRGFRTHLLRVPEHALSVAVFCNVSTCDPARRVRRIVDVYLSDHLGSSEPEEETAEPAPPTPWPLSGEQVAEYVGTFYSPELDTTYWIRNDGDGLRADHWRNDSVTLVPVDRDRFVGTAWWFRDIRFRRDAEGRVVELGVTGDRVRNLRFFRRSPE